MAIEDFTTYTEDDDSEWLTVTANKAAGSVIGRNDDCLLYSDKGVAYFNALDVLFECYIATIYTVGELKMGGMGFANSITSLLGMADTDICVYITKGSTDVYNIGLLRGLAASNLYQCSPMVVYYCKLERTAASDTVTLKIYSNWVRTDLLATLSVGGYGTATRWRYSYGFLNLNDGSGAEPWAGFFQNLDLRIAKVHFKSRAHIIG